MTVSITRTDLTALELRKSAILSRDTDAARRMLALARGAASLPNWVFAVSQSAHSIQKQTRKLRRRLKNFAVKVEVILPDAARDKPLEVWLQDEARVGQKGTLTRVWAERGSRPRAPRDTRYKWAYIFGAVCPDRAATAALVMPCANAMNLHLGEIATAVAPSAHAVLIMDGAGWHKPTALNVPSNITLMILPPYAPELNPVENVWAYIRANKLAISVFDTYDDVLEACCDAWNFFAKKPKVVRSITTRQWAKTISD